MDTPQDIINAIGRLAIADRLGCPYDTVKAWYRRNSIPPDYWDDVARIAAELGHPEITRKIADAEDLAKLLAETREALFADIDQDLFERAVGLAGIPRPHAKEGGS